MEKKPEIDEVISLFSDRESPLVKAMRILELAVKERKFTLSPVVAKYTQSSHEVHLATKLFGYRKDINHFFVKPIRARKGVFYCFELFIPVPIDISEIENKKTLLKEHWEFVQQSIPMKMRRELIYDFEPLYTIDRVYGWNGSWIAYGVTVKEIGDFWSPPLVKCPYNGVQPFICLPDAEVVILENDETERCRQKVNNVKSEIATRVSLNKNILCEESKSIEVAPEWILASIDQSNPNVRPDLKKASQDFGGKIGLASIDKKLPDSAEKLLETMKQEAFGEPVYEFTEEEIGSCKIYRKV